MNSQTAPDAPATPVENAHTLGADEVARLAQVHPNQGLEASEAARRLDRYGPNELEEDEGPSRFQVFLRQFTNALVLTLIAAAVISGALLQDWIDAGVILAIVFLNAAIGYSQEAKAADAAASLKRLAVPVATVVRGGMETEIPTPEVVPGDVILIETGDRIPADGRLIQLSHLRIDESELTGESVPVDKTLEPVIPEARLGDRSCMVFSGTTAVGGRAHAVVTATGEATEIGKIAGMLSKEEPPTPLEREMDKVGKRLGLLATGVAVIVFALGLTQGKAVETMFLLAVALAVAAIPEGLPAVVGITLGRGVREMASRNAIVRRMPAVEALGAVTVICTDKTGTLTRNEIWVQEAEMASLAVTDPSVLADDPRILRYAELVTLNNDARESGDRWLGDPTEIALLRSVAGIADIEALREERPRLDEIPFEAARKRMTTVHGGDSGYLVVVKGAPEVVIPLATRMETAEGIAELPVHRADSALSTAEDMASRGLRTLAVAYKVIGEMPDDLATEETDLILVAVTGMKDELRPEAATSIAEANGAGIQVVMVTGDHEVTARSIANELGLLADREVIGGKELATTPVDELAEEVADIGAFARVDPADKVKIVDAWRSRAEIVAMTGDGVNDAPALRTADVGVAMGSGTDVARDASDIVLADDNFATIVRAVREGRTIFTNIRKVIFFLLAANVSEVLVVFSGFLLFASLGEPLLATQLLWVNLVTDGLPALALGFDAPEPGVMLKPPERSRSLLDWRSQVRLVARGAILAVAVLAAFFYGNGADLSWVQTRTIGFTVLVIVQMTYVYALRVIEAGWREGLGSNRLLHGAVIGSLVLHALVVATPLGNELFQTVPITGGQWALAFGLAILGAVGVLILDVVDKRLTNRD